MRGIIPVLPCFVTGAFRPPWVFRGRRQQRASAVIEEMQESETSSLGGNLDPLLIRLLTERQEEADHSSSVARGGILAASAGLHVWRSALSKGHLPTEDDFTLDAWPPPPFFASISKVAVDLQLPRLVQRHPKVVSVVLLAILRLAMEFQQTASTRTSRAEIAEADSEALDGYHDGGEVSNSRKLPQEQIDIRALADEIAGGLMDEFGGMVGGVSALDQLFGMNHDILDVHDEQDVTGGDRFGLQDGIWQHSGWTVLPQLQRQLEHMSELRDLLKSIGRRPSAESNDGFRRFAPRKLNADGGLGAQCYPLMRETVSGLTLSSSFSEMLPSEAVLLRGPSLALRRLFLAKKVESKLLSYELSGWLDTSSIPHQRPRYLSRLPSAPGGPLVVCLDTSWSMSGARETLSKAVTVACVAAAHKQSRDCQVVAFSTETGVMETGKLTADSAGVRRLLDFLSHSFGGGTDVTGALKHAMATMGSDEMSAADLLLVTDGEIPDPPVSDDMMQDLDRLKRRTGMQIHGILVGKDKSKPLSRLCSKIYDFLVGYEAGTLLQAASFIEDDDSPMRSRWTERIEESGLSGGSRTSSSLYQRLPLRPSRYPPSSSSARSRSRGQRARTIPLHVLYAKRVGYPGENERTGQWSRNRRRGTHKRRFVDDDDELWELDYNDEKGEPSESSYLAAEGTMHETESRNFITQVEEVMGVLRATAETEIQENAWKPTVLDGEKDVMGSCWRYRAELQAAVERVGEGLVERDEESRLVVLGMVAQEHVLLLGPPGTAKSALGRRLSKLCGGQFFQRLLTRFTTPEEIFGPLSLRALENDEYRRCTEGFLPTASVAFLDEIFKANSAILNTLLTILNERQFDNGAGSREFCPIRCVVGASNELPETDDLDALYDRFLLRKSVMPVSDDGIMRILTMPDPEFSSCNSSADDSVPNAKCDVFADGLDNVVEVISGSINAVKITDDVGALIRNLRGFLRDQLDVDVSDRRLVKAARLLKISAASHGRTSVDLLDCLLLQHVAWRLPEQRRAVRDWLWEHLTPGGDPAAVKNQFRLLLESLRREAIATVRKTSGDVTGENGARDLDVAVLQSVREEATRLTTLLQKKSHDIARHVELLHLSMDHLWLDPDEAKAAQQILLPKADEAAKEIEIAFVNARTLNLALSPDLVDNDVRLTLLELLWDECPQMERTFTEEELSISMKEAKAKYDGDGFRAWKRARKRAKNK